MLSLKKIAVTGGLASGKSTVCRMLEELGAYVVSADAIAHQLLSPDSNVGQRILEEFGSDLETKGTINRTKLAEIVFSNPEKLKALEAILHPAVFAELEKRYQEIKHTSRYSLFVAEVPLLYEVNYENQFDCVIAVTAPDQQCRQRFVEQGKYGTEEFELRMARQISPEEKAKQADYVIQNNSTLSELKTQVKTIYSILTST